MLHVTKIINNNNFFMHIIPSQYFIMKKGWGVLIDI